MTETTDPSTAGSSRLAFMRPELREANDALRFYSQKVDDLQDKLTRAEENLATMYAENERLTAESAQRWGALVEIRRIELEAARSGMVGMGEVHDVLQGVGL